jgi:hypothetical protein
MMSAPYLTEANHYAQAVRQFVGQTLSDTTAPTSYAEIAGVADTVVAAAEQFNQALLGQTTDTESVECWLSKMEVDLTLGLKLLEFGDKEQTGQVLTEVRRSSSLDLDRIEEALQTILGEVETVQAVVRRGLKREFKSVEEARKNLSLQINTVIEQVVDGTVDIGDQAFKELLKLPLPELSGLFRLEVSAVLNAVEPLNKLYELGKLLISKAYELLEHLLGKDLLNAAAKWLEEWVDKLRKNVVFKFIVEQSYAVEQTKQELTQQIESSTVAIANYQTAMEDLTAMLEHYRRQTQICSTLLTITKNARRLGINHIPILKSVLLLEYALVLAYLIFLGGDCVDTPHLKLVDFIVGVRRIADQYLN